MQPAETHPRPQLTRERWTDLGGEWGFAHDDADAGLDGGWHASPAPFGRRIVVPFPPESRASGVGDPGFHPVVWYRRTFRDPRAGRDERLLLHFGAVDYRARVWVNGRLVAAHEGGHTPFSADITGALHPGGGEQVVVVRAEDRPGDLTQPRGKQFWEPEPRRIWYGRTTGIWQPVWLEPVPKVHIREVCWTPDLDRGVLGLDVGLDAASAAPLRLRVRLALRGATLAEDEYAVDGDTIRRDIAIDLRGPTSVSRRELLWSPRFPNLIDAELALVADGRVVDAIRSYAGLRSVGYADGRFLLNGWPYYLRLVLGQGYWPGSHLAAPGGDALRREVELIKELGFNGVRVHQKVEDPRFLYWCDRLGLVVWAEMANAYAYSPTAVERLTREWLEVVRRDRSHPCVVTWVPVNESWGVPNLARDPAQRAYVRALYYLTHALDPTRPVIGNDGWEHLASDVWGVHDYAHDGATLRARYGTPEATERTLREVQPYYRAIALPEAHRQGEPIMLTECGGIGYAPAADERWFGYGTVRTPADFLARYEELIGAILDCPTIAGFCYTQLTDTEQETNGLLTADRAPKLDPAAVRAINGRPAAGVPGEALDSIVLAQEAAAPPAPEG